MFCQAFSQMSQIFGRAQRAVISYQLEYSPFVVCYFFDFVEETVFSRIGKNHWT